MDGEARSGADPRADSGVLLASCCPASRWTRGLKLSIDPGTSDSERLRRVVGGGSESERTVRRRWPCDTSVSECSGRVVGDTSGSGCASSFSFRRVRWCGVSGSGGLRRVLVELRVGGFLRRVGRCTSVFGWCVGARVRSVFRVEKVALLCPGPGRGWRVDPGAGRARGWRRGWEGGFGRAAVVGGRPCRGVFRGMFLTDEPYVRFCCFAPGVRGRRVGGRSRSLRGRRGFGGGCTGTGRAGP